MTAIMGHSVYFSNLFRVIKLPRLSTSCLDPGLLWRGDLKLKSSASEREETAMKFSE